MDVDLKCRIEEAINQLRSFSVHDIEFEMMDPVAKMMFVALINESRKIQDYLDNATDRIVERFCSDFIPYEKIGAIPAIAVIKPSLKNPEIYTVGDPQPFTYSYKSNDGLQQLNYIPLFNTLLIPHDDLYVITPSRLTWSKGSREIRTNKPNCMWVGISTKAEIENLRGMSLLISGYNGILPDHIYVGTENRPLDFSSMREMENIEMAKPFDAQQSSGHFYSFIHVWKENLLNMKDASLLYITDRESNRDLFKARAYPRIFQQWFEDETLDFFDENTLWLQLEFPGGYVVPDPDLTKPDSVTIDVNVLPVVNVDVNSLTLTPNEPIAKLQNQKNSFFLKILETDAESNKKGYNMTEDEIIVRDFDASCYHNGNLYRDIRNLYNRFVDDYYAFIDYHGIKDGEVLKLLRETINTLAKNVGKKNTKFKYDSGTYVMKNMNQYPLITTTEVHYITTQGRIGNSPQIGQMMEIKKLPAIDQKVPIVVPGMGGTDKASVDERYEQLRYYSLTNDRLYTKMDIDAFLRKEIMAEFGKEEFKRINVRIDVEGAGGQSSLLRGLYIDIEFKDKKNYEKAVQNSFDKLMKQKIEGKSCISMPIIIELNNMERE